MTLLLLFLSWAVLPYVVDATACSLPRIVSRFRCMHSQFFVHKVWSVSCAWDTKIFLVDRKKWQLFSSLLVSKLNWIIASCWNEFWLLVHHQTGTDFSFQLFFHSRKKMFINGKEIINLCSIVLLSVLQQTFPCSSFALFRTSNT